MSINNLLPHALAALKRGYSIFPLGVLSKVPVTQHGFKDATNDVKEVTECWTLNPRYNIGIACGASNLTVIDVDSGFIDQNQFEEWRAKAMLPRTHVVRTGRRLNKHDTALPNFAVHIYLKGACDLNGCWEFEGAAGEIRSTGGYVVAEGSVYKTHEIYSSVYDDPTIEDAPLTPQTFAFLQRICSKTKQQNNFRVENNVLIPEGQRHNALLRYGAKLVLAGTKDMEVIHLALSSFRDNSCVNPSGISDDELLRIAKYVIENPLQPFQERVAYIGNKPDAQQAPPPPPAGSGARADAPLFHTGEEFRNAPAIRFAIDRFLQDEGINALTGPPGHGKSLTGFSLTKSLLEGGPLFGYEEFAVNRISDKLIYLSPEVGLTPFAHRLRLFNLMGHVDDGHLLCQTLSHPEPIRVLDDPRLIGVIEGADLILDTATRFYTGEENSASEMKNFSELAMALVKIGAQNVTLIMHANKSVNSVSDVTENSMIRGTSEFRAMLSSAWGIYQEETDKNVLYVKNLKARDFEAWLPFRIQGRPYINEEGNFRLISPPGGSSPLEATKRAEKVERWQEADTMLCAGKTVDDVAAKFQVTRSTVYNWINSGYCPAFQAKKKSGVQ